MTTKTPISTPPLSTTTTSYGYPSIHPSIRIFTERRKKTEYSRDTHITIYDGREFDEIKIIEIRNNTDTSSIISNLVSEFVLSFESKTPQTTLFNYEEETKISIQTDADDISIYLKPLSDAELLRIERKIQTWTGRIEQERNRR